MGVMLGCRRGVANVVRTILQKTLLRSSTPPQFLRSQDIFARRAAAHDRLDYRRMRARAGVGKSLLKRSGRSHSSFRARRKSLLKRSGRSSVYSGYTSQFSTALRTRKNRFSDHVVIAFPLLTHAERPHRSHGRTPAAEWLNKMSKYNYRKDPPILRRDSPLQEHEPACNNAPRYFPQE